MGHPLTIRLDESDVAKLDEIAEATDRKRSWHMARAIRSYIEDEYSFLEGVRRGVEAADRGDVVSQQSVETALADVFGKGN
jgi:RHH-type transcriptional regulator, rel operon repressor / antitoxin RelB